jgi:hypothetical protein
MNINAKCQEHLSSAQMMTFRHGGHMKHYIKQSFKVCGEGEDADGSVRRRFLFIRRNAVYQNSKATAVPNASSYLSQGEPDGQDMRKVCKLV